MSDRLRRVAIGVLVVAALVRPVAVVCSPRIGAAAHAAWPGFLRISNVRSTVTSARDPWGGAFGVIDLTGGGEQFCSSGPDRSWRTPDDLVFTDADLEVGLVVGEVPILLASLVVVALWWSWWGASMRSRSLSVEALRATALASVPSVVALVNVLTLATSQPVITSKVDLSPLLPPGVSPSTALLVSPLLFVGSCALAWRLTRPEEERAKTGRP